jgi:hypothetical protein
MLDVHAPHKSTHTWTDFFIHMGTICLGLLIALGLEQAAEYVHRQHQRHQLEQDLRAEGIQNLRIAIANLDSMDILDAWQAQQIEELDRASAEGRAPRYIPRPPGYQGYRLPSEAVWTVAENSTTLSLIPRAEADQFAHPYALARLAAGDVQSWNHLMDERSQILDGTSAFVPMSRFSTGGTYDLSHMTKENLARFRDVTVRIDVAARGLEGMTANFYNFTWGTLHGYTDDENFRRKAGAFDTVLHGGTAGLLKKFPIPDENSTSPTEDK